MDLPAKHAISSLLLAAGQVEGKKAFNSRPWLNRLLKDHKDVKYFVRPRDSDSEEKKKQPYFQPPGPHYVRPIGTTIPTTVVSLPCTHLLDNVFHGTHEQSLEKCYIYYIYILC